jgi:hypothetical protein
MLLVDVCVGATAERTLSDSTSVPRWTWTFRGVLTLWLIVDVSIGSCGVEDLRGAGPESRHDARIGMLVVLVFDMNSE